MLRGGIRVLLLVAFFSLVVHAAAVAGARVRSAQRFRIEPALCAVAERPSWLSTDDVEEIRRSAGLGYESLPLLDPGTARRLADGHSRSAWVRRVAAVRFAYPDRAVLALEIRKPLAGILVKERDIVLLDEEGRRLPGTCRRPPPGLGYPLPRIEGAQGSPPAPGRTWSPAVTEGVAVAREVLGWPATLAREVPLLAIDVGAVGDGGPVVLRTAGGALVEWGRSQAHEFGSLGPGVAEKVRKLEQALRVRPSLVGIARLKLQFPDLVVEETPVPVVR
jgi:hypothetical protein